MNADIRIERTTAPRSRPADESLGFGKYFTDHMLLLDWDDAHGWHDPRIVPYGPLSIDPAAGVLHYGQAMFEGAKAIRGDDGVVRLFRAEKHCERMSIGAPRLCMPSPPPAQMLELLHAIVKVDEDWVPRSPGTALYLRPTLIAMEPFLGVRAATKYLFYVILSPVGAYYGGEGLKPVRIWVETQQTRAAHGGLGGIKAGANYAASLYAAARAKKEGYDQVLWLDGARHENIEEVGTMNLFALIGDELVTPLLGDSILAGVTRECVMALGRERGLRVTERTLPLAEVLDAHTKGTLREVFGSGTAAVVSPVGELILGDRHVRIGDGGVGPLAKSLYEELSGIQRGTRPDRHGWLRAV